MPSQISVLDSSLSSCQHMLSRSCSFFDVYFLFFTVNLSWIGWDLTVIICCIVRKGLFYKVSVSFEGSILASGVRNYNLLTLKSEGSVNPVGSGESTVGFQVLELYLNRFPHFNVRVPLFSYYAFDLGLEDFLGLRSQHFLKLLYYSSILNLVLCAVCLLDKGDQGFHKCCRGDPGFHIVPWIDD